MQGKGYSFEDQATFALEGTDEARWPDAGIRRNPFGMDGYSNPTLSLAAAKERGAAGKGWGTLAMVKHGKTSGKAWATRLALLENHAYLDLAKCLPCSISLCPTRRNFESQLKLLGFSLKWLIES